MKYCPDCGTEYDEEVIQFCTKDGTPLLERDEPHFTAMPSESSEDAGEDTVVRRRDEPAGTTQTDRDRIVIPATPVEPKRPPVRTRPAGSYYAPPSQQPNTGKVVALTILGTLAAIGFGALLFWALSRGGQTSNINVNTNPPNMNINANTNGFDSNFNFNSNVSSPPVNIITIPNTNTNVKTPTPTPKPSPSVTPSIVPTETPERTPRPTPSGTPRTSPTPTPRTGPRPPGNLSGYRIYKISHGSHGYHRPKVFDLIRGHPCDPWLIIECGLDRGARIDHAPALAVDLIAWQAFGGVDQNSLDLGRRERWVRLEICAQTLETIGAAKDVPSTYL